MDQRDLVFNIRPWYLNKEDTVAELYIAETRSHNTVVVNPRDYYQYPLDYFEYGTGAYRRLIK